ncbi:hypothetical protein EV714DRAFT_273494 [Schizophyllum commune]
MSEPQTQVAAISFSYCIKLKLSHQLEGRRAVDGCLPTPPNDFTSSSVCLCSAALCPRIRQSAPNHASLLFTTISRRRWLASAVNVLSGSPKATTRGQPNDIADIPKLTAARKCRRNRLRRYYRNQVVFARNPRDFRANLQSSARTVLELQPSMCRKPSTSSTPPTVLRKCTNAPASAPNATEIGQLNDSLGIDIRSSRPQCLCSDASRTCTMARRPDRSMTHLVDLHIPIRRKRANGDAAQEQMIRCHARASMTMLSKGVNADAMQERQCTRAKGIDPARARPIPRRPGSLMISRTLPLDQADASARTTRRVKSGPSRRGIRREARSLSPRIDRALCNVFVLGTNGFSLDVDGLSLDNERQEHRAERQEGKGWQIIPTSIKGCSSSRLLKSFAPDLLKPPALDLILSWATGSNPTMRCKCINILRSEPNATATGQLNDHPDIVYADPRCFASASMPGQLAQC